jgi:dethiobiotin synthetase
MQKYFIAGIGTDVGKTLASAILAEKWQADYWKPVQSGSIEGLDSDIVRSLISNPYSQIHKESYVLKNFSSPHYAAALEGLEIQIDKIKIPKTGRTLLIEGAGGIMVPLSDKYLVADLIKQFSIPVILVCRAYLGAINHTLLSIDYLERNNIPLKGLIFNSDKNSELEKIVSKFKSFPVLARIPECQNVNKSFIKEQADKIL